jgi:5'-methylthioadenosine phosphorylase
VILGSGFDPAALELTAAPPVPTPYGEVRDALFAVTTARAERGVVLLRHGAGHNVPPHRINHRAHLFALRQIGVTHLVSFSSAGALRDDLPVGDFGIVTDFVDHTKVVMTFADDKVVHTPMIEPLHLALSDRLAGVLGPRVPCHSGLTYVGISGPRYATPAEMRVYAQQGDLIGMTVVHEAALAAEIGVAYASACLITDAPGSLTSHDQVVAAAPLRRKVIAELLPSLFTTLV